MMDAKEFVVKLVRMCNDNLICNTCIAKDFKYLCPQEPSFFEVYSDKELGKVAEYFVGIVENWEE